MELHVDALALEHRLDQLVEAARDDVDVPARGLRALDELGESGADSRVLEHPGDDLVERRRDRRELPRDHLAERHRARVEAVLDLLVDGGVAELERDPVEQVGLGDRAVEVEHDRPQLLHFRLFPVTHSLRNSSLRCDGEEVGGALK